MQLSEVLKVLRCFFLAFLCFALLSVSPCASSSNLSCLNKNSLAQHPIRRHFFDEDPTSVALVAASKAHLSQVVFTGTLMSVLVQRDGVVRATFGLDRVLKPSDGTLVSPGELEVMYFQRRRIRTNEDSDEDCLFKVNEENLRLGTQYVVFGHPAPGQPTSVTASAFPIPYDKRTFKAIKRVVCKGCARPPRIAGLKNVQIVERRKLRLHCHLSGNPIPWVEWYKNGQSIDSLGNRRIKVKTKRRISRLVIRQSRLQDQGVYECRAVNIVQDSPAVAKAIVTVTKKTTTKKPVSRTTTTTVSSLWPSERCPQSDFCLNGGTCIFYKDVMEYVCQCSEGYIGLRCDFKDVRSSLGGIKSVERDHNRIFVTVVVLFVVLSCLNWGSIAICWLYCFRSRYGNLKHFQKVEPPSTERCNTEEIRLNQATYDDINCSTITTSRDTSDSKPLGENKLNDSITETLDTPLLEIIELKQSITDASPSMTFSQAEIEQTNSEPF